LFLKDSTHFATSGDGWVDAYALAVVVIAFGAYSQGLPRRWEDAARGS